VEPHIYYLCEIELDCSLFTGSDGLEPVIYQAWFQGSGPERSEEARDHYW